VDFLIDYIINVHHAYLKKVLPELDTQLTSFIPSHLKKYPESARVGDLYAQLSKELSEHTAKEEEILFPYLKQVNYTWQRKETYGRLFVRTLGKPVQHLMEADHARVGHLMADLRKHTNRFTFDGNACTNYQVIWQKMNELDRDLSQHHHLEHHILFPKVMEMEKELLGL
jgi:regulator of cell morphogenesis and NO signaling